MSTNIMLFSIIREIRVSDNEPQTKIIFNLLKLRACNYFVFNHLFTGRQNALNNFILNIIKKKLIMEIIIRNLNISKDSTNYKRHIYRYNIFQALSSKINIKKLLIRMKEVNNVYNYWYRNDSHVNNFCLSDLERPDMGHLFGFKNRFTMFKDICELKYLPTIYEDRDNKCNTLTP